MDILISGAGIAGPTLAWWLAEHGYRPTIVEEAPAPRTGGYVIDFWGKGYDIAERMGILPELIGAGYKVGEVRMVGDGGRRRGGFKTEVFDRATKGRFVSLPRGELSASLNRALGGRAETLFDNRIASLVDDGDAVNVTFEHGEARRFGCVIGAEGIHSETREMVFGPHEEFEKYLGYKFAAYIVDDYAPRDIDVYVMHSEPGIQAARFALRDGSTLILLIWLDRADAAIPHDESIQKTLLRKIFQDMAWEGPQMLGALDSCRDLYMDTVSQVRMEKWAKGRVALLGDAAFAPSFLAGQGSALAMIGAYVLAGEFKRAGGDHEKAFRRYQRRLDFFMREKQKAATRFAGAFAPKTRFGITFRNWVTKAMGLPLVSDWAMGAGLVDQIELPDY
jgi:2-polyprenyl-6-methoxyphenol hydroxylase-like FAD-dependent oxidoreductase